MKQSLGSLDQRLICRTGERPLVSVRGDQRKRPVQLAQREGIGSPTAAGIVRSLDNSAQPDEARRSTLGMGTSQQRPRRLRIARTWVAACAALAGVSLVPLSSATASGTVTGKSEIRIRYPPTTCPAGTPQGASCFTRTGTTLVPGLGRVEESYACVLDERPVRCPEGHVRGLPSTARLTSRAKERSTSA